MIPLLLPKLWGAPIIEGESVVNSPFPLSPSSGAAPWGMAVTAADVVPVAGVVIPWSPSPVPPQPGPAVIDETNAEQHVLSKDSSKLPTVYPLSCAYGI